MPNFTIKELTFSNKALAENISNVPDTKSLENLLHTINMLEEVRKVLGNHSMAISSGYRCAALNRAVGGVADSAHVTGLAVDFTCTGFGNTEAIVKALYNSGINYDQLILEYPNKPSSWVHIGFAPQGQAARRQCLITTDGHYKAYRP